MKFEFFVSPNPHDSWIILKLVFPHPTALNLAQKQDKILGVIGDKTIKENKYGQADEALKLARDFERDGLECQIYMSGFGGCKMRRRILR